MRAAYTEERTRSILTHSLTATRHDSRLIHERVCCVVLATLSGGFAADDGAEREATDEAKSPGVSDTRKGWF